ncbi:toll/interleukin-1 receptor domain-containing protein [Streptomyces kebangsaanensis]|uniref:Toll/interleukin-1 receptor domain-containing protein n=1 Tax=Streptomyces kebangsaanensis TaxID=864058 RepID=A0ABW6KTD9_9ACTN
MTGIFINYRTGDGERAPELVDERLVRVFGGSKVFRDRRSMRPGTNFPEYLRRELENCTVLLALIGPRWLDIRDEETGVRRIDMPKDYVHDEIATAIALNKIVIPVLLDAELPPAEKLPPSIVGLNNRQALHMREGYAHHDLAILTDELRQYVPEKKRDKKREKKRDDGAGPTFHMGSGNTFTRNAIGTNSRYYEGAGPREEDENDEDGNGRRSA